MPANHMEGLTPGTNPGGVFPDAARQGTALCLSGGGFRATLFHLGGARRLHELGRLNTLDAVSSVSGGSIFAAFLAQAFHAHGGITNYEEQVAKPVRRFCSADRRTRAAFLARLKSGDVNAGVDGLARVYEDNITRLKLYELPVKPNFTFCATDMVFMVNWIFTRERMGDYKAGYRLPGDWSVARAVAASSCFPPVFRALRPGFTPQELRDGLYTKQPERDVLIPDLALSDGGVYDNMGLEPVWKSSATVLVSDASGGYDFEAPVRIDRQLLRYTEVSRSQALALRKRWLISSFQIPKGNPTLHGAYWSTATEIDGYNKDALTFDGYSDEITAIIAGIRTDLDTFSPAEQAILENHGYALADAALRRYVLDPATAPPPSVPHPEWWKEDRKVKKALEDSHQRNWFGR